MNRVQDLRISDHPYLKFVRGEKVKIWFDGKEIEAYTNETVGTSLYASGVRIFSRSLKYHRPRGLYCVSGRCASCLLRVNGVPNVRVCTEPVQDGTIVESQNSSPNVSWDIYSILDRLDFLFPVGFQYKHFIRPSFVWRITEKIIKSLAGLGKIPDADARPATPNSHLEMLNTIDVAVVGGGPAGLSAAISAAGTGARVALFDENDRLGGHLARQTQKYYELSAYDGLRGFEIAGRLREEAKSNSNLEIFKNTIATGYYSGGRLAVNRGESYAELTPKSVVVTTGAYNRRPLFENNDMPGIISASGAQTLMHIYGIRPGRRAVVASSDGLGRELTRQLADAGVNVAALIESSVRGGDSRHFAVLRDRGIPVLRPYRIKSAHGRTAVEEVTVVKVSGVGGDVPGTERAFSCDTLCVSAGVSPAYEILFHAGCDMNYDGEKESFLPNRDFNMKVAPRIFAAGHVCGTHGLTRIMFEGRIAGISAALLSGHGNFDAVKARDDMVARLRNVV